MIIDLTMSIDEETPVFPGDPKQEIKQYATIKENGWNEKRLTINSHFSTHIDAPFHMLENGKKLTIVTGEKLRDHPTSQKQITCTLLIPLTTDQLSSTVF